MRWGLAVVALVLCALPAPAVKPVARPAAANLDEQGVNEDSAGVLVRFLGVAKNEAQAGLDAVAKTHALPGRLRIGFVKTLASSLAAVYIVDSRTLTVGRLKELALACSQIKGAKAAYAFVHPGPRNEELEVEAYWMYEAGRLTAEKRIDFRDDDGTMALVRRSVTSSELDAKKWPRWPLSELSLSLGIPGRDFLERPMALLELATHGFPRDVGENLVRRTIYLPDATLLEIRQLAEKLNLSTSRVVQDTLVAADADQKLGEQLPTSDRAPWDEGMLQADKSPLRPLSLFLTREVFARLDDRSEDEGLSFSRLVEYAWRRAHPFVDPKQGR